MEGGEKGEKTWENCHSIINKIYLKRKEKKSKETDARRMPTPPPSRSRIIKGTGESITIILET